MTETFQPGGSKPERCGRIGMTLFGKGRESFFPGRPKLRDSSPLMIFMIAHCFLRFVGIVTPVVEI